MDFKPHHDLSSKPADVLVFNCSVYVKPTEVVTAWVANLAGIEFTQASARQTSNSERLKGVQ